MILRGIEKNLEHLVLEVRMSLGYRKNKCSGGPDAEKRGIGIRVCKYDTWSKNKDFGVLSNSPFQFN